MSEDDVEQVGFEDGYYDQRYRKLSMFTEAYARGYWGGCHVRYQEDQRLAVLVEVWKAEDAATQP